MIDVPWTPNLKLGRFELVEVGTCVRCKLHKLIHFLVRELFSNGSTKIILTVPYHYDYRKLMECGAESMFVFSVGGAKCILLLL